MSETLDRTPTEGYGNECCAADGCQTCFRVEFDREVNDEDGTVRTERYYSTAFDEMTAHLKVCQPYLDQLKAEADAKAAAEAEAAQHVPVTAQPAQVYDLGNGTKVIIYKDANGDSKAIPLPDGVV